MMFKLPDKVRAGDKVSARWMNQLVDCVAELGKGTGAGGATRSTCSVKYSPASGRDIKYRDMGDEDLPVFIERGFELRLKPEYLCQPSGDEGYTKVLQVRCGLVVDYASGLVLPAPSDSAAKEDSGDTFERVGGSLDGDAGAQWTDMFEVSEVPQSVYCIIRQDSTGMLTAAALSTDPEPFRSWRDGTDGVLSVLIGRAHKEAVEEQTHFYIEQEHIGAIELSGLPPTGGGSYPGGGGGGTGGSGTGGGGTGGGGTQGSFPGGGSCCCTCIEYEFDEDWFSVEGNRVTLKADAIDRLVQEAVDDITLDVQVTGLVEATAYGNLRVTSTGEGSLDGTLGINSTASY